MASSSIEWTEMTWNPVTGCNKISAGCKFCYAERMAKRLKSMGVEQYKDGFKLTLAPKMLELPYSWKKSKIVFVNSMSDLFHPDVPTAYIKQVFEVMNNTPQHTYQVLTKRAERLKEIASELSWTENIWMGVSVEQEKVSYRIPLLIDTPAKTKFLSVEPLIGAVKNLYLEGIDWVIVGGESGPKARPIKKAWIDFVHDECKKHNVPFFFKQWGKPEFNVDINDPTKQKENPNYAKGGCQLDGDIFRTMPELQRRVA
ncbi:phage Gp37/Gp68 family protein [soil metagenome]